MDGEIQFEKTELISISTQVVVDEGRPDIEVRSGSTILVYIEIKHDSSLGEGQLEYYKKKLDESGVENTALVLLTRSLASAQETILGRDEYHHVCWYDVHRWLSEIKAKKIEKACIYLIEEFIRFLEGKQMSLERIGWEYMNGVPSLVALSNLLEVAILETTPNVNLKRTGGSSWLGFNLDAKYFCGVRYAKPLIITYEDNGGNGPTYTHYLDMEKEHFFSLSQAEQLECLVNFIQKANAEIAELK